MNASQFFVTRLHELNTRSLSERFKVAGRIGRMFEAMDVRFVAKVRSSLELKLEKKKPSNDFVCLHQSN